MNENKKTPEGWTVNDAVISKAAEEFSVLELDELRLICRKQTGTDSPDATFWDLKMNSNEKRVILQAAGLPHEPEYQRRKFKKWTPEDQRRIKEAAKRASDWAASLGVA